MKLTKRQIWLMVGAILLMTAMFMLGYLTGKGNLQFHEDVTAGLTPDDMRHAFGSIKSPDAISEHTNELQKPASMSLNELLAGLEKKVAADPGNIDQQLLLAQTYNELDSRSKSLKLLNKLHKLAPKNVQVKITLATILMNSEDKQELNAASQLFDEVIKLEPDTASMAGLYQGEIKVKLSKLPR